MTSVRERAKLRSSASIFAALGESTRLELVARLCQDGPQSIARLTRGSSRTRQAITKHLRVLSNAGVVRGVRVGRESRWELDPRQLELARAYLDLISTRWDAALERLQRFVEDSPG